MPDAPNVTWSMGVMADRLKDECRFRQPKVLDDVNCAGSGIEVDLTLPAERAIRSLNRIVEWRDKTGIIRLANDTDYISAESME